MIRFNASLGVLVVIGTIAFAQDSASNPKTSVPTYPNVNCPVMGKPASTKVFVDTIYGRVYLCCASCNKKVRQDPEGTYKAAYPKTTQAKNTVCPVSGDAIEAGSPTVKLQGYEINLCCKDCVKPAQDDAQVVLAKALNPKLKDVGNTTCPISGKPVVKNAFIVIGDEIVHLSASTCVQDAEKVPAETLKKAKESVSKAAESKPESRSADHHSGDGHGDHGHHQEHHDQSDTKK